MPILLRDWDMPSIFEIAAFGLGAMLHIMA